MCVCVTTDAQHQDQVAAAPPRPAVLKNTESSGFLNKEIPPGLLEGQLLQFSLRWSYQQ